LSAQFPVILFLFDWLNKAKINPLQWDRDNSMIRNWFSFPKDYSEDYLLISLNLAKSVEDLAI
jgi:hypothetical protein